MKFTIKEANADAVATAETLQLTASLQMAQSKRPKAYGGDDGWYFTPRNLAKNAEWAKWAWTRSPSNLKRLVEVERQAGFYPRVMRVVHGFAWRDAPDDVIDEWIAIERLMKERNERNRAWCEARAAHDLSDVHRRNG